MNYMYTKYSSSSSSSSKLETNSSDSIISPREGLGGLFLGDFKAAQDHNYFRKNKITCVLTVAASAAHLSYPASIITTHKTIAANDHPSFKLTDFFTECFEFIHENRSKGLNVFVHCMAGVSRSATIVIGYIMTLYEMDFQDAYQFVKKKRSVVRPNDGFVKQLKEYSRTQEETRRRRDGLPL